MTLLKRLKSLAIVLSAALSLWTAPIHAQGTIPLAMAQQVDINGQPLAGCLLTFYVAGTPNSLQNAFADFGLSQPLPNPLTCDQTGRIPMFWLADGLIHVRLTDASGGGGVGGSPIIDTTMQVLGPSSGGGGGGGGTVDPTTVFSSGDMKAKYGTGSLTGWVRCNGLTVGNATSGATERSNTDTQNLFVYLWNTDPNLVVSGGRGVNALADFNGGKTIALPDWRGQGLGALADMGNTPTSLLTAQYFLTSPTVLGAAGGLQSHTHSVAEIPQITSIGVNAINVSGSNSFSASGVNSINVTSTPSVTNGPTINAQPYATGSPVPVGNGQSQIASINGSQNISVSGSVTINSGANNTITVLSNGTSGVPFSIVGPMKLATFYMKL